MNDKRHFYHIRLVVALFFLSPLIAEFLLGNQPITTLPWVFLIAPIYGGAAILIREFARRTGRGWPTILLLGAAFGLLLEGIIDQMLFNPGYLGLVSFDGLGPIPVINSSTYLLQGALTLHAVWSIGIPIALVEAFDPKPKRPWLGFPGLAVIALLFLLDSVLLANDQSQKFHFMASPLQLGITTIAVLILIISACMVPRGRRISDKTPTPSPKSVGLIIFGMAFADWFGSFLLSDSNSPIFGFALGGLSTWMLWRWSHRYGWNDRHRLAVAGGALMTYVCVGFIQSLSRGIPVYIALPGNIIFGLLAIILLRMALRVQKTYQNLHKSEGFIDQLSNKSNQALYYQSGQRP